MKNTKITLFSIPVTLPPLGFIYLRYTWINENDKELKFGANTLQAPKREPEGHYPGDTFMPRKFPSISEIAGFYFFKIAILLSVNFH